MDHCLLKGVCTKCVFLFQQILLWAQLSAGYVKVYMQTDLWQNLFASWDSVGGGESVIFWNNFVSLLPCASEWCQFSYYSKRWFFKVLYWKICVLRTFLPRFSFYCFLGKHIRRGESLLFWSDCHIHGGFNFLAHMNDVISDTGQSVDFTMLWSYIIRSVSEPCYFSG